MVAEFVSIVVPTYGGKESLSSLVERTRAVLQQRGNAFEIVIVNDASPDDSWPLLCELSDKYSELVAIDLLHNHGQMRATLCGLAHARGDIVITMDDDLQHPPEEIPKLLDALDEEPTWDAVVGAWPRDEGLARNFGSWVHARLDRLAWNTPKHFRHTSFRAIRRPVVDAMLEHQTRLPVMGPLLRQSTNRVFNVPVVHQQRPSGSSGFRMRYGIRTVLENFFQGSTLPLRLMSRIGLLCTVIAFVVAGYLLIRWALGQPTLPGWTSSLLAIVFFGGATLFGIGILGEYTHLMMQEVRRPPRWSIRSRVGSGEERAKNEAVSR